MSYFRMGKVEELPLLQNSCLRLLQQDRLHLLIIEVAPSTPSEWEFGFDFYQLNTSCDEEVCDVEEEFILINSYISYFRMGFMKRIKRKHVGSVGEDTLCEETRIYTITMNECPFIFNKVPLYYFPLNLDEDICYSGTEERPFMIDTLFPPPVDVEFTKGVNNSKEKEMLGMIEEMLKNNYIYHHHFYYTTSTSGGDSFKKIVFDKKDLSKVFIKDDKEMEATKGYIYCICDRVNRLGICAFSPHCPLMINCEYEGWSSATMIGIGIILEEWSATEEEIHYKYMLSFSDDGSLRKWIGYEEESQSTSGSDISYVT